MYVNWYLAELGSAWSDALGDTWPVEGLSRQDTFFSAYVSRILQRNDREKVFVIISDAMRYEIGDGENRRNVRIV